MKRFFAAALAAMLWAGAFAQNNTFPAIDEIAQVENADGDLIADVFSLTRDGQTRYYLNVGALGHGDEVLQVVFDPVSKLYIPLGETFTEAFETMEKLQELYGNEKDTVYETEGNLAPLLPTDEMETVKITTRKYLFSRKLEFSLEREDHIRATYLSKSDFNNLMFSLKVHRKLHPNLK